MNRSNSVEDPDPSEESVFMQTVRYWAEFERTKRPAPESISGIETEPGAGPGSDLRMMVIEYQRDGEEAKVSLRPGQARTFGRDSRSDQRLPADPCISGLHFSIQCNSRGAMIGDLGSSNGTFVNGERIEEASLNDGDQIIAGMTVFTIQYSYV